MNTTNMAVEIGFLDEWRETLGALKGSGSSVVVSNMILQFVPLKQQKTKR